MPDLILLLSQDAGAEADIAVGLRAGGYEVRVVADLQAAEARLARDPPDLVLLDDPWPKGLTNAKLEAWCKEAPVLVLCGDDGMDAALRALRLGASEFLAKPVNGEELAAAARRVIDHVLLYRRGEFYTSVLRHEAPSLLVGESPALRALLAQLAAVAATDATVLILGESGVGKEKVAQEVHRLSPRADGPLVAVDCCSLPETLFESELFGHERGAFTGAAQRKPGLIEEAKGGTLFLDEIGEIPASIQAKLLRVLETKRFRRLGAATDMEAQVRIVAATNRDLDGMAQRGEFRQDLLYRLNTFVVAVPPLRERREDIAPIVHHFLNNAGLSKRVAKRPSDAAMAALIAYDWPGNVRELRNVVERAIILSGNKLKIGPEHLTLPRSVADPAGFAPVCPAAPLAGGSPDLSLADSPPTGPAASPIAGQLASPAGTATDTRPDPAPSPATGESGAPGAPGAPVTLAFDREPSLAEIEREYLRLLLARYDGRRAAVARVLGIGERTLYRLLAEGKAAATDEPG